MNRMAVLACFFMFFSFTFLFFSLPCAQEFEFGWKIDRERFRIVPDVFFPDRFEIRDDNDNVRWRIYPDDPFFNNEWVIERVPPRYIIVEPVNPWTFR